MIEDREELTIKDMVLRILDQYPEARENDMILAVKVYHHFYGIRSIFELMQPGIPQYESLRRMRQRIQSDGLYKRRSSV